MPSTTPQTTTSHGATSAGADCGCEAPGVSRRSLLRGLLGATGLALAGGFTTETTWSRYAYAAPGYTGDTLVVLSLRGGFDGLSAVVPTADPDYLRLRPTIGVPQSQLLPATSTFGLHPAFTPLLPFWKAGTFGAVHAVGQADPTRSHFEAMAEMERAAPGTALRTGWIDRTLGVMPGASPFKATQFGWGGATAALAGPNPELVVSAIDDFELSGAWNAAERARWATALAALHAGAPATVAAPATTTLGALATTSRLKDAGYTPAAGVTYPDSDLAKALKDVARLVKGGVGLQVACVELDGWDMHENLGTVSSGRMLDGLTELAGALAAFATDLGPQLADVTVVTLSEFGRRVEENGTAGTDHGHGNAVLLLGGGVAGGTVHGRWPGLSDDALVDGDLAGVVDYRLVLGEILTKRCGVGSLSSVFPKLSGTPLGVVRART